MIKWIIPILGLTICGFSSQVMATCSGHSSAPAEVNVSQDVVDYNSATFEYSDIRFSLLKSCNPRVFAALEAMPAMGDLSGSSPFKPGTTGFTTETSTWIRDNVRLEFALKDASVGAIDIPITDATLAYMIMPGSPVGGGSVVINGDDYYTGAGGLGMASIDLIVTKLKVSILFTTPLTTDIINEINSKPISTTLVNLPLSTADINDTDVRSSSNRNLILNLQLQLKSPTCTVSDTSVDLGTTTVAALASNQVVNQKDFDVQFQCEALPSNALNITISDAFNGANLSETGVLLNQPGMPDAANDVGVQLLTEDGLPVKLGTQTEFIPTDSSAAPQYSKTFKAQLYRTGANPSLGRVNTQATVTLEYE